MPAHIEVRTPRNRYAGRKAEYDPIASPRQIALLERLVEEREMTEEQAAWYLLRIVRHRAEHHSYRITKVDIKKWFGNREAGTGLFGRPFKPGYEKDPFKALPQAGTTQADADPEPDVPEIIVPRRNMTPARIGIYQHGDNIYVVRKRRGSDRVSAFRLVESPPRLAANGKTVHHDWARDYRMVWVLREEERVTDDDAVRELNIKVGACVMCNHAIWQAKSVRRMMGTRCYKRVHGLPIR
jgi:hypothetical protein